MDDDQQFCLRWNNHQSTLISVFDTLLENGTLVDCTLAAEGKFLKAHKVVLSACSPYFAALLSQQYDKHPIFILKDVKFQELRAMMDYMYRGEVNISQDQLAALLKAAESLQIKGLSDSRGSTSSQKSEATTSKTLQPQVPVNKASGLTIENKRPLKALGTDILDTDISVSREGSTSPTSRKRKKIRRKSLESNNLLDNHDQHSNSSSQSMHINTVTSLANQSSTSTTVANTNNNATSLSVPSNNVANIKKTENIHQHQQQSDALKHQIKQQQQPDDDDDDDDGNDEDDENINDSDMENEDESQSIKHKDIKSLTQSELMIEPKNEYDDGNDENVEDLTLDDEELLEDMEQPGPSHGGEGSSQGYAQWQMDRAPDEAFMGQEGGGQHRDAQVSSPGLSTCMPRSKLEALTPPLPSAMDNEQPCDLRLLTPATCLRELANASTQQQRELMAVAAGIAAAMPTTANTGGPNTTSLPLSPMYKGITMTSPSPVPSTIGGAYTCSRCGNSYARPHSLNRHIRFECGVEPKFECPVCHKKSKHKHNLVLHMRTHQHR